MFYNKKTFLIWVNEEDRTRAISLEKGDVKGVFEKGGDADPKLRLGAHVE